MSLSTPSYTLDIADDGAVILSLANGLTYRQLPPPYPVTSLQQTGNAITLDLTVSSIVIHVCYTAVDDTEIAVEIQADGALSAPLDYPNAWLPHPEDTAILPISEGIAIPVKDTEVTQYLPNHGNLALFPQFGLSAILNSQLCLATAVLTTADAMLTLSHTSDGDLVSNVRWLPSKGQFAYTRKLSYLLHDSLSDTARHYRQWREQHHDTVVTLAEKARRNPNVHKLFGAADVWLWDDNAMNRLYARPETDDITPRNPQRVADDMLQRGMTRILWNAFEGEVPEDCHALKGRGFLVGKYDIYRDVLPKPLVDIAVPYRRDRSVNTRHWPDIVRIDANGDYAKAWKIHGKDGQFYDQHAVCDMCALRLTMENVPPDVARVGYTSRLIDVQCATMPAECYAPLHPTTRADSLRYINTQNRFLDDIGLVVGVEVGQEACVQSYHYAEGMMSPGCFRAPDAGRRMCTQYRGNDIPPQLTAVMLNPRVRIPLWELIYHDCAVSTWYWGDSSNSVPELMPLRDLFNALYGVPPLYSLSMSQWDTMKDDIAASYHRATPVAALTATAQMTSFEWLAEGKLVQRTTFSNNVSVIVNFSGTPVTYENTIIPPQAAFVISPNQSFLLR